ncbi:MAG: class I SAM-dependent methyltransferase, partial [Verrucomicrobia bacterium]|nr:class I SAM-dependent methyltransferase [Verrucomicrobiota bacterium]
MILSEMSSTARFLFPSTYWRKARAWWLRWRYDPAAAAAAERERFRSAGFDRANAERELDRALAALGRPSFAESRGMASVHWLLLAAVASQRCCGRILEIGTFDGETTALMARLFPASRIVTLDLPPDDPILGATYGRSGPAKRGAFERRLAANTAVDRIALLRVNSFFLPSVVAEQFDLIWLDGGHLYPE